MFVQVLTQQATQREAAERFGVDRSTVVGVCHTAKQGVHLWMTGSPRGPRAVAVPVPSGAGPAHW
jgi:hypothetical protein